MFDGSGGARVYKRRKDAEFIAGSKGRAGKGNLETIKVRVSDEKSAEKIGISIHTDLSIAARKPKEGETGWIVLEEEVEANKKFGKALEVVRP